MMHAKHAADSGGGIEVKPSNFFALLSAAASAARQKKGGHDFQEYLKKSGIKTAWVRAIVALYEESRKPDDPLSYILRLMGLGIPDKSDVKRMQIQVKHLRSKLHQAQRDSELLRESIELEEQAIQQRKELVSLYDDGKYFSEYNSDDDYDIQHLGIHHADGDHRKHTSPNSYNF